MNSYPKVSIQIPCYNQATFIEKAIKSALNQSYTNLEVVVSDDNSTDETFAIASEIRDNRLKVFRNEKNIGRVANYHHLLYHLVSGDWVINLDGDDSFSDPEYVARAVYFVQTSTDVVLYMANCKKLKQVQKKIASSTIDEQHSKVLGKDYLMHYNAYRGFNHMACMFNRSIAMEAGFYSFNSLNADFQSIMKLGKHGSFILSSCIIGTWKINEESATNSMINEEYQEQNLFAMKQLSYYYKDVLTLEDWKRLEMELMRLQNFHFIQSILLLGTKKEAIHTLISQFSVSVDYIIFLGVFIIKRLLGIRSLKHA